ncbi:Cell wall-associated polypeptide CWBP200 [Pragia fontium]|nr:Cell wall-associated polypeptide CWBP200 [Pragia fontium]
MIFTGVSLRCSVAEVSFAPLSDKTEAKLDARFFVYYLNTFEPLILQCKQQGIGSLAPPDETGYYFYQNDPNGMPLRLHDAQGEIVWSAHYTVFGQTDKLDEIKVKQPLRLQGQYFDEESGLHYNRHRYYDPATGVFVSQDPIGLVGGLNPYRYAANTFEWCDPLGLWKKHRKNGQFAKKPGRKKKKTCNSAHGNSHDTDKPAEGYTLRDRDSGDVAKYGETTQGDKRYSQKYLDDNNVDMFFEEKGTKKEMHSWQHDKILDYKANNDGERPRLNNSDY